ncbi:reverse transcriptase-like protein [Sphingomonas astaxanthinifaciens]|uniref:RNase H type-1 domain-containing protein n=1 Tax=Sphingomonas astaxanthinifaciens DSM 22298 TaxID=1123267 RepID=A0ABQ5Z4S8_9SPHN|nr:reverse transcriptase-like protein [Sphingomonas astaxanthinifaciens]GLR47803.1 hypothetical protein GCM10007925_15160 [Sphingomonas astaxanthinifaciens DSM 22298]
MTSARVLKIFFDGGCRPNPGRIEVAVVARGQVYFFDDLGTGDHADAEWLALGKALEVAQALGAQAFDLIGDSLAVVRQANGQAPCRNPAAQGHKTRFDRVAAVLPPRRIRWIARHQNLAGIALDRRRRA